MSEKKEKKEKKENVKKLQMDTDYKELYLQQKIISIRSEMQLIQVRFNELNQSLPIVQEELKGYLAFKKKLDEENDIGK